jgi:hypothetical protein
LSDISETAIDLQAEFEKRRAYRVELPLRMVG